MKAKHPHPPLCLPSSLVRLKKRFCREEEPDIEEISLYYIPNAHQVKQVTASVVEA